MNFDHANQPPAAMTPTMTTMTTNRIADPWEGAGVGLAFAAAGFRAAIGAAGAGAGGVSVSADVGSPAKTSSAGAGGVNGAAYPVAPPSAGTSIKSPREFRADELVRLRF